MRVERRLLEEVLAQQAPGPEHDALGRRERVGAEQLDDLEQLRLALEQLARPRAVLLPFRGDLAAEPAGEVVERVAAVPVDRREVPLAGERGVQRPERARQSQRVLGDRLGEVAARRRDRADDAHRALALPGAEAADRGGALVELGQPGRQVGGVALLGGHLLKPAGDLAQRLAPAAGRVGHERDVVALVAEVLRERDPGVDRRLACGDRHVRGVRDQDGPLHQRRAGPRVDERGELLEHLGELVAALAAADVDDHVGVGPLRQRLLEHGLAGAEAAGDGGGSATSDRE